MTPPLETPLTCRSHNPTIYAEVQGLYSMPNQSKSSSNHSPKYIMISTYYIDIGIAKNRADDNIIEIKVFVTYTDHTHNNIKFNKQLFLTRGGREKTS